MYMYMCIYQMITLLPQWVNPERACQSDCFQLLCAVPDIPHLIVKMPAERERERERGHVCYSHN